MIEILTFKLREGADEEAFLAADKRVQAEFAYQQPGLMRRTTARAASPDEGWAVIDLWKSDADADACDARWGQDEATAEFMSFVDLGSVSSARYYELD